MKFVQFLKLGFTPVDFQEMSWGQLFGIYTSRLFTLAMTALFPLFMVLIGALIGIIT